MPISVEYGPSPTTLGTAMYGAGANIASQEQMQELLELLLSLRSQNLDASLSEDQLALQEKLAEESNDLALELQALQGSQQYALQSLEAMYANAGKADDNWTLNDQFAADWNRIGSSYGGFLH